VAKDRHVHDPGELITETSLGSTARNCYTECRFYAHGHSSADTDTDSNSDADAHANRNTDSDSDADTHPGP
jgi:hypothetical protein